MTKQDQSVSPCTHSPKVVVKAGHFNAPDGLAGVGLFISVQCGNCGEPYVFPGFRGVDLAPYVCEEAPTASPDHTVVRLPIYPRSAAPAELEPAPVWRMVPIADIPFSDIPEELQEALGLSVPRQQPN